MQHEMSGREAGERYDRLVANLATAEALMRYHEHEFWARWLSESRRKIVARDAHGLSHLLGSFGGTGSFNDVVFHSLNGDELPLEVIDRLNWELASLRTALYSDAKALLHDFQRTE